MVPQSLPEQVNPEEINPTSYTEKSKITRIVKILKILELKSFFASCPARWVLNNYPAVWLHGSSLPTPVSHPP